MKIRMTRQQDGSTDGTTIRVYEAGRTYDMRSPGELWLAGVFVGQGWAEEVQPEVPEVPPQASPKAGATEQKVTPAPENKARRGRPRKTGGAP